MTAHSATTTFRPKDDGRSPASAAGVRPSSPRVPQISLALKKALTLQRGEVRRL